MSIDEVNHRLSHIRTHYGRRFRQQRVRALKAGSRCDITDPHELRVYHDLLLFVVAFPDDSDARSMAEAELKRVAAIARQMTGSGKRRVVRRLAESGIANTLCHCGLSFDATAWLARRFGRDVEIAWDDESAGELLDDALRFLTEKVEADGLMEEYLSTQEWMRLGRGRRGRGGSTDLEWLISHVERIVIPTGLRDWFFDSLQIYVRWRLRDRIASRTFARLPRRTLCYQREGLHRGAAVDELLARPIGRQKHQPLAEARRLIDLARAVLAVRHRETDPITHAHPRDVMLVKLERGVDLLLFGIKPEERLPIETYYGYLVAKNRVPIGYGGGWVFLDRCEIGVNVFDTFRGGESAYVFAQILRVYRQLFKVGRFLVDPFQFGAANREGIQTGAFWFYYRLGFRPVEPSVARRAEIEWERRHTVDGYRTSAATLRRLAGAKLERCVDSRTSSTVIDLKELSLAVTDWIGREFDGERVPARRWACSHLLQSLGTTNTKNWSALERQAFEDLSLVVAPIPDLADWSGSEKAALISALRAKGGPRESTYALRIQRHRRLRSAWNELAKTGRVAS